MAHLDGLYKHANRDWHLQLTLRYVCAPIPSNDRAVSRTLVKTLQHFQCEGEIAMRLSVLAHTMRGISW